MGRGPHQATQIMRQLEACTLAQVQRERERMERKVRQSKARSEKRPKCRCAAYPWPHRPSGGLCRWPDPPTETWKGKATANKPQGLRYRGVVKIICQQYGLHPVKDRQRIERLMPWLYPAGCKRYWPLRLGFLRWQDMVDERDRLRIGATPDPGKIQKKKLGLKQWREKGLRSYEEQLYERPRQSHRE